MNRNSINKDKKREQSATAKRFLDQQTTLISDIKGIYKASQYSYLTLISFNQKQNNLIIFTPCTVEMNFSETYLKPE